MYVAKIFKAHIVEELGVGYTVMITLDFCKIINFDYLHSKFCNANQIRNLRSGVCLILWILEGFSSILELIKRNKLSGRCSRQQFHPVAFCFLLSL